MHWARRRKFHFTSDAFNTLLVLSSQFPDKQVSAFLLESRDFQITLPTKADCRTKADRRKIKVSYVAVGDESIVRKIDREIVLTYCKISTTHNVFSSQVCMDSVWHEKVFSVDIAQKYQMNVQACHRSTVSYDHA